MLFETAFLTFCFPDYNASEVSLVETLRFFLAESSFSVAGFIFTTYFSAERPTIFAFFGLNISNTNDILRELLVVLLTEVFNLFELICCHKVLGKVKELLHPEVIHFDIFLAFLDGQLETLDFLVFVLKH